MTLRLPATLHGWIRGLPQWSAVGLALPQQAVQVRMSTARGDFDVTRTCVVAALRPLTLAIGLDAQLRSALQDASGAQLHFIDLDSGLIVGTLRLRHVRDWETSGARIGLFEIEHGAQQCLRWPYRSWNRWLQTRSMRKNTDPTNFHMAPEAVQQLMIFCICPRPVVLVSVEDDRHSNLFPMDLIGSISADHFTLALRSTSQSIGAMKSSRKVALSDVPASAYALAYKLGAHHRKVTVDWSSLPCGIQRSREFNLPWPQLAPRVRELAILDFATIGSHTFFVTRIASEQSSGDPDRFAHTSGIYQHFRSRMGRPFASLK
jgi:flavin reductase (DIM6/NTAB) family NADH-FMN oxidoreductase RutF